MKTCWSYVHRRELPPRNVDPSDVVSPVTGWLVLRYTNPLHQRSLPTTTLVSLPATIHVVLGGNRRLPGADPSQKAVDLLAVQCVLHLHGPIEDDLALETKTEHVRSALGTTVQR